MRGRRWLAPLHGGTIILVSAELARQPLHLVLVQVLLDQIALPLYALSHIGRNIRNHPGQREFDQEDNMLQRKEAQS